MRRLKHPTRRNIKLTEVLYALSDPLRLAIVRKLARLGEHTCGACDRSIPKSTLSHHFKVLRETGIIRTRMQGTRCISSLRVEDLEARFTGLLKAILHNTR